MSNLTSILKRHSLIAGICLMFLLTWPIDLAHAGVMPFQVPFAVSILVGYGFVLASIIMTGITLGKDGVITLLKRFLIWRVSWKWYLVAFLLLPTIHLASVFLTAILSDVSVDFSTVMAYEIFEPSANLFLLIIPWFLFEIFTNGEEIGWRGYVLPRLQARYGALVSSLIVGLIWGFWHLPKFLGTTTIGYDGSFGWFMVANLALAVLYTWLYNNTGGSLLLVTIFHASGNTAGMFLPISFAAPGGIMPNLLIVLLISVAVVITVITGSERLSPTKHRQIQEFSRA
jgi:membrane protease YdiL (CAAX protease family)